MKPPACAACRHQRRACKKDCALAPFFPADRVKDFEAAHKLFGVHNIVNNLNKLAPEQKGEAITAMVYEANARVRDPVTGSTGIIILLFQRIEAVKRELEYLRNQIGFYRSLRNQGNFIDDADSVGFLPENINIPQPPQGLHYFFSGGAANFEMGQSSSLKSTRKETTGGHQRSYKESDEHE